MVDTIILRVHDLRKHKALCDYINQNFNGTSMHSAYLTKEDADTIRNSETIDGKMFIDYFWNSKSGTHLIRFKSQKKLNSSQHYYFHVFENFDKNYLEFNFSIPKYVYGTNVLMFCEHVWSRDFIYVRNSSLEYNLKRSYDLVSKFILTFFKREFPFDDMIDFHDVEVNRIDISYNQVFDCKKSAQDYLEFQKKLRKKNLRLDSNNHIKYDTSLMFKTERYSLKIYHKGPEYAKHDRKEHLKINTQKGYDYFDIEGIQDFADHILRYEISFRDSMLSYLYNQRVFRRNCPIHKARYEVYKKVESVNTKNDAIAKRIGMIKSEERKQRFIQNNPYLSISKEHYLIHKKMTKLLNLKRQFYVKTNNYIEEYNSKTVKGNFDPRALFSKALFIECARFFKSFVNDFQIHERPQENIISDLIDIYNSEHYRKLPKNEMMKFYTILQIKSFDEILKSGYYSRATFFRYKSRFKLIGITQNFIIPFDHINVPMDLSQYHQHLIYCKKLIRA
jgi:hypothetical protein